MMLVRLDGITEIYFNDLVEVEPSIAKVREAYKAAREALPKDAPAKDAEELNFKLQLWCDRHFGQARFNQDWRELFGTDESSIPKAVERWTAWVESKPLNYRKLYYSPRVVAECVKRYEEE